MAIEYEVTEPSLDELEAAVHRAPADVAARRRLAMAYVYWGEAPELGIALLEHARRLAPRDAEVLRELGVALIEAGRPRAAIPHLEKAALLDPSDAGENAFNLGHAHDMEGDAETAASHFRKAAELKPRIAANWIRLAFSLAAAGRHAEAIPAFEKALGRRPESARLWSGLAACYAKTGQHPQAVQAYRLALRYGAVKPQVLLDLCGSCERAGQLDEVFRALAQATRIAPTVA